MNSITKFNDIYNTYCRWIIQNTQHTPLGNDATIKYHRDKFTLYLVKM